MRNPAPASSEHGPGGAAQSAGTLTGHSQAVSALAITPDRQAVIIGRHDRTLLLWQVSIGRTAAVISGGRDGRVSALALSPGGRTLATTGEGKRRLWILQTQQITQRICQASTTHH